MPGGKTIEIAAGNWRASICPEAGGVLAALSHADHDVLRPMPQESYDTLQAACFPLVPYANRVRLGRFSFGGHEVRLPLNHPPGRHTLHGLGWQRPWVLHSLVGASLGLVLDHGGTDGWPWPWRAMQVFALDSLGLTITLTLTNEGSEDMPAGLGLHPYFRRWRDTRAQFTARQLALSDIEIMPTGELVDADHFGDFSKGIVIPASTIDHCYAGWDGTVTIDDGLGRITMRARGASNLHVFAPGTGRELCFEPVNHLPDALNREEWAMPVLAPGETATLEMRIEEA